MRIVRRANQEHTFEVIRPFIWNKKKVEVGDMIEITDEGEQVGYFQRKMVLPADVPKRGVYIALRPLTLPGLKEAFKAKRLEQVELTKEQAIDLMLERAVIPASPNQWRPGNARIKTDKAKGERRGR